MRISEVSSSRRRAVPVLSLLNFVNDVDRQVIPKEVRSPLEGACDIGMFARGATGIALGGIMAQSFGWRMAFFFVGIPGLLSELSAIALPDRARARSEAPIEVRELLRVPAGVAVLGAGWFSSFAGLGGALGIRTGAYSDRLNKRKAWGGPLIIPIGFLLAAPAILAALRILAKIPFLLWFGLGAFFMSWYHGRLTATIHDLIPPSGAATALGLYYWFVKLFAMALTLLVGGRAADRYELVRALHIPIAAQLMGGACFVLVALLIRQHGLHHRVLRRHCEPKPWMPSLVTADLESSSI